MDWTKERIHGLLMAASMFGTAIRLSDSLSRETPEASISKIGRCR